MLSKKESKTSHVRRPSQRSLCGVARKFYIFLNRQLPLTASISLQSLSPGWTVQYVTRIFLFRDIRLSGKIESHTREAVEYSSMSKTSTRPASLKNGPQYLKAIFNNYG